MAGAVRPGLALIPTEFLTYGVRPSVFQKIRGRF
jgi:hypothetical protein